MHNFIFSEIFVYIKLALLDEAEDHVVLLLWFHGDEVHAEFTALIAGVQPVVLLAGELAHVAREKVVVVAKSPLLGSCDTKINWFIWLFGYRVLWNGETHAGRISQEQAGRENGRGGSEEGHLVGQRFHCCQKWLRGQLPPEQEAAKVAASDTKKIEWKILIFSSFG